MTIVWVAWQENDCENSILGVFAQKRVAYLTIQAKFPDAVKDESGFDNSIQDPEEGYTIDSIHIEKWEVKRK